MQMFPQRTNRFAAVGRIAAAALFATSAAVSAGAQQATTTAEPAKLDLQAALKAPFEMARLDSSSASDSMGYSSSAGAAETASAESFTFNSSEVEQPPPRRRRYGRPNYNDRWHNQDGSSKLAFNASVGFNIPVGSDSTDFLKTSYRFQVGAGYNMSRKFGIMLQFDWDNFGLPANLITSQRNLYQNAGFYYSDGTPVDFTGMDGHTRIWSFTLNPTYNFYQGEKMGAYVVGGGGFYHKTTNFTLPQTGTGFDPYYGYYQFQSNQSFDAYTSNSPGVNGGIGVTYKFSRFASERFFAEAKYVHTFNSARIGDPAITGNPAGIFNNLYPPNSNETSYIPITFGVRW